MSSGREIYFTKVDEAAFSRELRAKYPDILFAEDIDKAVPGSGIVYINSIDVASSSRVDFFLADPGWKPEFGSPRFESREIIANIPECHGLIDRSSNGWGPNEFNRDGEPRWIEQGHVQLFFDPPPTKAQRSFRDAVWRIFPRIGTWRLKPYHHQPRLPVDRKKTDKMIWAGNDALRWARENPLRMFSGGSFLYRPLDDDRE